MGLLGLAVGCAALTPIAFGHALTPAGLQTAAMYCLLFGAGCQLLAGLGSFLNHNLFGGTLFTTFTFNWLMNWWSLKSAAAGNLPDHTIVLAVDVAMLLIFVPFTYGFGFFSRGLFLFLLDIDLLFVFRLLAGFTGSRAFALPIALCTVALAGLSLWLAFAILLNPTVGRTLLPIGGPLFTARRAPRFDDSTRQAIFDVLYAHQRAVGSAPLPLDALERRVTERLGERDLQPDLAFLAEMGGVVVELGAVRLTAAGIDLYERVALGRA